MQNNLMLTGLDVVTIDPHMSMPNVSCNKALRIVFNADLNENTTYGNIFVLEDTNRVYKGDKVVDVTLYKQVIGKFAYGDKVVMFQPSAPLNRNSMYLVYIPAHTIKDILGKQMELDFVSYFMTETDITLPACEIVFPTQASVVEKLNGIVWKEQQEANTYLVEVSKSKTFEHLIIQEMIVNPIPDSDGNISFNMSSVVLNESLYYTRVRALNGEFGEVTQFFIKSHDKHPVSIDDSEFIDIAEEIPDELEVLEYFPEQGFSNVAVNLKTIYIKLNQCITPEMAKTLSCSIVGELSDEMDVDDDTKTAHGSVNGTWTVINDRQLNESYIVFTLGKV